VAGRRGIGTLDIGTGAASTGRGNHHQLATTTDEDFLVGTRVGTREGKGRVRYTGSGDDDG